MWKILVVDDNPDILEAVSLVLSRKNMDVMTLEDPEKLHQSITQFAPDLLLMDIAMGNYDGRNLCREIKTSPDEAKLPVILFSARNYPEESISQCKADSLLAKPFRINELYEVVYSLLPTG